MTSQGKTADVFGSEAGLLVLRLVGSIPPLEGAADCGHSPSGGGVHVHTGPSPDESPLPLRFSGTCLRVPFAAEGGLHDENLFNQL